MGGNWTDIQLRKYVKKRIQFNHVESLWFNKMNVTQNRPYQRQILTINSSRFHLMMETDVTGSIYFILFFYRSIFIFWLNFFLFEMLLKIHFYFMWVTFVVKKIVFPERYLNVTYFLFHGFYMKIKGDLRIVGLFKMYLC